MRAWGPVERFQLLANAGLDPEVTKAELAVLTVILVRLNGSTGIMFDSLTGIARDAGISRRAASRAVTALSDRGLVCCRKGNSGGLANTYWMGTAPVERAEELVKPRHDKGTPPPLGTAVSLGKGAARGRDRNGAQVGTGSAPQLSSYNSAPKPMGRGSRSSAVERVRAAVEAAERRDELARSKDGDVIEGEFTREMQPAQTTRATSKSPEEKYRDQVAWINQQAHLGAITKEERLRQLQELNTSLGGGHGQ